ncbi:GNAT family N-acetyltransferase [Georgenia muralis]
MKRALDLTILGLSAPIALPLTAITAVALRASQGGKVIFRQTRVGLHKREFTLLKFRTMRNDCDADGQLLPDSDRITRIGRIIRKLSLDELPQLVNILRGEMSFVGPRPLLPVYVDSYTGREHLRHSVRPGITGLAQVNGRNSLNWNDRLELDVQYVESHSVLLDVKILWRTLTQAVIGADVSVIAGETGDPLHVERAYPRTEHFALRRLYRRDLGLRVEWFNDDLVNRYMQVGCVSLESTEAWYENATRDRERYEFSVVDTQRGTVIAMSGLRHIGVPDRVSFYVVVDPELHHRGLGRVATSLTLDWARHNSRWRIVHLTVHRDNRAALQIYEELGFRVTSRGEDRYEMELALDEPASVP